MAPRDPDCVTHKIGSSYLRKRRLHTRTKTGCLVCRQRHIRCGEQRPSCAACVKWGGDCVYPNPDASLPKERTVKQKYPGMQAPWRAESMLPKTAVDPFDSLPIKMPLKSRGLIQHFAQVFKNLSKVLPKDSPLDLMAVSESPPAVFRSILLTAASHYAHKSGGLNDYESTYRFHMAESVRDVNDWLSTFDGSKQSTIHLVQIITALSINESRVGNYGAAKAHLDGLLTVLDLRDSHRRSLGLEQSEDLQTSEHFDRCVLIAEKFLSGLWDYWSDGSPHCYYHTNKYLRGEIEKQDERLQALSLVPFFINTAPGTMSPREVDAEPFLDILRYIAPLQSCKSIGSVPSPKGTDIPYKGPSREDGFVGVSNRAAELLTWFGQSYSTSIEVNSTAPLRSAPMVLCIIGGLYIYRILGLKPWDGIDPIETRLMRRKLLVIQRDVELTEPGLRDGTASSDIWFVKTFCIVFAMDIIHMQAGRKFLDVLGDEFFWSLRSWFIECVGLWSDVTGIRDWERAKDVFMTMFGPETMPREALAVSIWNEVTAMGSTPDADAQGVKLRRPGLAPVPDLIGRFRHTFL